MPSTCGFRSFAMCADAFACDREASVSGAAEEKPLSRITSSIANGVKSTTILTCWMFATSAIVICIGASPAVECR
jgi:hypothetical protein